MGNAASNYAIIRVTPTVTTDAYAVGDVLFTATEIPNAVRGNAGCSKLLNMYIIDEDKQTFDAQFYFTENNTALGTINETANIGDDAFKANQLNSIMYLDKDQAQTSSLDNQAVYQALSLWGSSEAPTSQLIQAASGSSSVYVQGIITSGTPQWGNAGNLELIFHIEYK